MTEPLRRVQSAVGDHYRIEREIGSGGMATVYLADDVRHHRKVAIKVLREEIGASLGAARFTREIEVAAQLQHPHVLPLLDSGEGEGLLYYVMPFIEGESLRDRLEHGELPVGDAVRILCEVVDALVLAHSRGVVHRDIKPDNILLSGRHALVADFGVAKALSEAGHGTLTSAGMALGTPAYMAPEQAAADPHVDHRADIYAVGVVAYEMISGRTPFAGMTPQKVLAAHVTTDPVPVDQHRPGLPAQLVRVVMRCLAKRPADRFQTAQELLDQLEALKSTSGELTPASAYRDASLPPSRQRLLVIGGAAGVILLALLAAMFVPRRDGDALALGRAAQLTFEPGLEIEPSISPDGRLVAYSVASVGPSRLFIRQPGAKAVPITPDSGPGQRRPLWSPDGTRILFLQGRDLALMPSIGGVPRIIVQAPTSAGVVSAAWSPDGSRIAYVIRDTLFVSSADGTGAKPIGTHDDVFALSWSPDGRHIAMSAGNAFFATGTGPWFGNMGPSEILTVPAEGGPFVSVTDRSSLNVSPVWTLDGQHLLFVSSRDGPRDIYSVRIGSNGRPSGTPARVTTGLGAHSIALSPDGKRIAYSVFATRSNIWSLPISSGAPVSVSAATRVTSGNQIIETLGISKDGKRLYYDSDRAGNTDVYRLTLPSGEPTQLTTDSADEWSAEESPDGRWVAFHSLHFGTRDIVIIPANGGQLERVTSDPGEERFPQWSPDGMSLTYWIAGAGGRNGIYIITRNPSGGWGEPQHVVVEDPPQGSAVWMTSGRTLLAWADGSVIAIPADGGPRRTLYSPGRGPTYQPVAGLRASPDGRHMILRVVDRAGLHSLLEFPLEGRRPRLLVRFDDPTRPSNRTEFATDGKRIYFTIDDRQSDIYVAQVANAP